jgi:hypothetical protein
MKAMMTDHIDHIRGTMFRDSASRVKRALEDMMQSTKENMLAKKDEIFSSVERDYSSAILGSHLRVGSGLSWRQHTARSKVHEVIDESEALFKRLVGPEADTNESNESNEEPTDKNESGASIDNPTAVLAAAPIDLPA